MSSQRQGNRAQGLVGVFSVLLGVVVSQWPAGLSVWLRSLIALVVVVVVFGSFLLVTRYRSGSGRAPRRNSGGR